MMLPGKAALITGGAGGLGRAFAEALLKKEVKVCICDINVRQGEAVLRDFRRDYGINNVHFVKCDVTDQHDFQNAFREAQSQFGRLDIVVNNAGIMGENKWKETVEINLIGVIRGSMLAMDHMRRDRGGHGGVIVNISSTAGLTPVFFEPAYAASKYGVVGFTRSWASGPAAKEMGIQFSCLCPAFTDTGMANNIGNFKYYPNLVETMVQTVGINSVQSVVDGFLKLVTDDDSNGCVLTVTPKHGLRYRYGGPKSKL